MLKLAGAAVLLALVACGGSAGSSGACNVTAKVPLVEVALPPAAGKTLNADAIEIDQQAHLLFVADRTASGVDVLDISTADAQFLTTIRTGSPNGLAVAPDLHQLLVGLNSGSLAVVDIDRSSKTALSVLRTIATGGKSADLVGYDARDHKAFVADPVGGAVYDVDLVGTGPPRRIDLGKELEQPAWDPTSGHIFVAGGAGYDGLYEIDPATDSLVKKHDLKSGCQPSGVAINPGRRKALLGCAGAQVLFWDLAQHRVSKLDRAAGAGDLATYTAVADRYLFAADAYAGGPEIAIFDGSGKYLTAIGLPGPAKSAAYDETNQLVYTADTRKNVGGLFKFGIPSC
jgi:DNA-binding beta-propeller fold protein YncE